MRRYKKKEANIAKRNAAGNRIIVVLKSLASASCINHVKNTIVNPITALKRTSKFRRESPPAYNPDSLSSVILGFLLS